MEEYIDKKQKIINYAKKLSLDTIGFTECRRFNELEEFFIDRKENNLFNEFEEEDIEKKINPKHINSFSLLSW